MTHYEIYAKPDSGPCTVSERDERNNWSWDTKAEAVKVATHKKSLYPNMDFLVHEVNHHRRALVHDTSKAEG